MGTTSVWMLVTSVTGYTLAYVMLAKRLRLMAEVRDAISLPDLVAARYSSETARAITAIAILSG